MFQAELRFVYDNGYSMVNKGIVFIPTVVKGYDWAPLRHVICFKKDLFTVLPPPLVGTHAQGLHGYLLHRTRRALVDVSQTRDSGPRNGASSHRV
jgi:hypothetical protein